MNSTSSDAQTAAQTATQAGPMVAPILYAVGPGGRRPAFATAATAICRLFMRLWPFLTRFSRRSGAAVWRTHRDFGRALRAIGRG